MLGLRHEPRRPSVPAVSEPSRPANSERGCWDAKAGAQECGRKLAFAARGFSTVTVAERDPEPLPRLVTVRVIQQASRQGTSRPRCRRGHAPHLPALTPLTWWRRRIQGLEW